MMPTAMAGRNSPLVDALLSIRHVYFTLHTIRKERGSIDRLERFTSFVLCTYSVVHAAE